MDEQNMFYGASPEIFKLAKELREKMTDEEKLLWSHLQKKQLSFHFKPQPPVSNLQQIFIVTPQN